MKTKGLILALSLLATFTINAAKIKGNEKITTQEFKVDNFVSIEMGGNISKQEKGFGLNKHENPKMEYSQRSGTSTLTVTMDENLFPYLDIRSKNGTLFIGTKDRDKIFPSERLIRASSDILRKVSISGSLDFFVNSPLKSDELKISVSGAGSVIMKQEADFGFAQFSISGAGDVKVDNLTCKEFEGKISGVGDTDLKGKADHAKFSISGAGDVNAYQFYVKDVTANVSGAGDIDLYASETLDATVSGIGDISYKGDAKVNSHKSGFGSIKKDN